MATVFEGTCLKGFNNKGMVKADADGYYDVVLSLLEFPNSYGAVYDLESARAILDSPLFRRRIDERLMCGELGHPQERDCKNYDDYVNRIHTILESNTAIHIRKVWIDENYILPNGRKVIAIRGLICPDGPHADVVKRRLENPHANLAFSVRSMATDRIVGGKLRKFLDAIITWDIVTEPGLSGATKFNSVSCESHNVVPVVPETLAKIAREVRTSHGTSVSCESAITASMDGYRRSQAREVLFKSSSNRLSKW